MSDVAPERPGPPKPCPFCGSPASWLSQGPAVTEGPGGESPRRAIGCLAPVCPIKPQTPFRDAEKWKRGEGYIRIKLEDELIGMWNKRAAKPGPR